MFLRSDRSAHSLIGVHNLERGDIRWITPDTGRDRDPVWSPGGDRIAFIRWPGLRFGEFPDITAGAVSPPRPKRRKAD